MADISLTEPSRTVLAISSSAHGSWSIDHNHPGHRDPTARRYASTAETPSWIPVRHNSWDKCSNRHKESEKTKEECRRTFFFSLSPDGSSLSWNCCRLMRSFSSMVSPPRFLHTSRALSKRKAYLHAKLVIQHGFEVPFKVSCRFYLYYSLS